MDCISFFRRKETSSTSLFICLCVHVFIFSGFNSSSYNCVQLVPKFLFIKVGDTRFTILKRYQNLKPIGKSDIRSLKFSMFPIFILFYKLALMMKVKEMFHFTNMIETWASYIFICIILYKIVHSCGARYL